MMRWTPGCISERVVGEFGMLLRGECIVRWWQRELKEEEEVVGKMNNRNVRPSFWFRPRIGRVEWGNV